MNVFAPTNAILKTDPTALLDFRSSWAIRQQHNWNVLNFQQAKYVFGVLSALLNHHKQLYWRLYWRKHS